MTSLQGQRRSYLRRAQDWWEIHFEGAGLVLATVATVEAVVWCRYLGGAAVVSKTLGGDRGALYGTLASIFGALLGFAITAMSLALPFAASAKLAVVRDSKHYKKLWRTFMVAINALGLATVTSLLGLLTDRGQEPASLVLYANVFSATLSSVRIWRVVWVLESLVETITRPATGDGATGANSE